MLLMVLAQQLEAQELVAAQPPTHGLPPWCLLTHGAGPCPVRGIAQRRIHISHASAS